MASPNTYLDIDLFLRRPAVEQLTGKSRTALYRYIRKGLFTKSVPIGGDRVAWSASEVAAINQARKAGKSEEEIKKLVAELEAARTAENSAVTELTLGACPRIRLSYEQSNGCQVNFKFPRCPFF
jgi:prophage regulatory protein